jgi:hypothetical protein
MSIHLLMINGTIENDSAFDLVVYSIQDEVNTVKTFHLN